MKRILREQLERIHRLNYGNRVLKEGFLDTLLGDDNEDVKKIDDPKKADLVGLTDKKEKISDDKLVLDFYRTLDESIQSGGLKQQSYGSMSYQKGVETMQIGLLLLGYELPIHGVDGLFGPETANAVKSFMDNNFGQNQINEDTLSSPIGSTVINSPFGDRHGRKHAGIDLKANSGTQIKSPLDGEVIDAGIKQDNCGGTIFIQHADGFRTRYCHCKQINVTKGDKVSKGDVIGLSGGAAGDVGRGRSDGAHLHFEVYKDGQVVNPEEYLGSEVGQYVGGTKEFVMTFATPEMLSKLKEMLEQKGVTPKDIKQYIDPVTTGGGESFTDLDIMTSEGFDNYAKICDAFISKRQPNPLGITGKMMASSARKAFERYQKYVPAELALAQLAAEGGIGNSDLNIRPIKTKNPFNVGNVDSGKNIYRETVQDGIDAYYYLIAKDYLGKGKTANDLTKNFVNKDNLRYAGPKYEASVSAIAREANRIAKNLGIS